MMNKTLKPGVATPKVSLQKSSQRAPSRGRATIPVLARRGGSDVLPDADTMDFVNMARSKAVKKQGVAPGAVVVDPNADLVTKIKAAWRIFFPEKPAALTPKEEGKKRLRMILVADRCGMTPDSMRGMRESIVSAMSNFVEIEQEEAVEVNMSMDPEIGTIYSVAVPVRRVKPQLRPAMAEDFASDDYDPNDPDSDPSAQFPYGT